MYFESFSALWHMSGHGAYVWSAYAACAVAFLYLLLQPLRSYRRQLEEILRRRAAEKRSQPIAQNYSETDRNAPD